MKFTELLVVVWFLLCSFFLIHRLPLIVLLFLPSLLACLLIGCLERASAAKRSEAAAVPVSFPPAAVLVLFLLLMRASRATLPATFL